MSSGSTTSMSRRSNSRRAAAVALGVVLARVAAQSPLPEVDWATKVKAACESPRYAIRRAASDELGRVGDPCIAALRAYLASKGRDRVPMLLVDALARNVKAGPQTDAQLRAWADDRDFFWRAQALTGLAMRGFAEDAPRFAAGLRDPSHLFRVAAAKGAHALAKTAGKPWDAAAAVLVDPDPRARVAFALHLWEVHRDPQALPSLVAAVADDRAFLDDDWGRRQAVQVFGVLSRGAPDFGYRATESLAANEAALGKLAKYYELDPPKLLERDAIIDRGGVELRSCRHGDLFVRWTDAEVYFDLDRGRKVVLDEPAREKLAPLLEATVAVSAEPRRVVGEVICDYLQLTLREPARLWKVAPGKVEAPLAAFLQGLATELTRLEQPELAAELTARLPQFAPR
jgi:hypothetical protein